MYATWRKVDRPEAAVITIGWNQGEAGTIVARYEDAVLLSMNNKKKGWRSTSMNSLTGLGEDARYYVMSIQDVLVVGRDCFMNEE